MGRRTAITVASAGLLVVLGLAGVLPRLLNPSGAPKGSGKASLRLDNRCRGGCPTALVQVLPGGAQANVATGVLTTATGGAITTVRASHKFCTKLDGGLAELGNNVPCVEAAGLLVEGPGSNMLTQTEAFGNAAWGKESTAPPAAPTVTDNSPNCTDPLGTHTASEVVFPAVAAGQNARLAQGAVGIDAATVYTQSVWAWTEAGASSFFMGVDGAGTGPNQSSPSIPLTTTPTRVQMQWTSVAGGGFNVLYFGGDLRGGRTSGPMAAQTVCLWGAQFEAYGAATSYIRSGASAGSREMDVVSMPNPILSATNVCMGATITPIIPSGWADGKAHVAVEAGPFLGAGTEALWWQTDGKLAVDIQDLSGGDLFYNSSAPPSGSKGRLVACRAGASSIKAWIDGSPATGGMGGTAAAFTQPSTLYLGSDSSGRPLNGWLTDLCVAQGMTCPL